jgi:hypothetical protein
LTCALASTPADQHLDVRIGFGNSAENLSPAGLRFNIADAYLQMPLAVLTAADEGRIQGHGDRRSRRIRPHRGLIPRVCTNFQGLTAQSLRVEFQAAQWAPKPRSSIAQLRAPGGVSGPDIAYDTLAAQDRPHHAEAVA